MSDESHQCNTAWQATLENSPEVYNSSMQKYVSILKLCKEKATTKFENSNMYCLNAVDESSATNREKNMLISNIKLSKVQLTEKDDFNMGQSIKTDISMKNFEFLYWFANIFNLTSLIKATNSFIERSFTLVVDDQYFLGLDYESISKILASSGLLVTSEVEVFNAADKWLKYDIEKRKKYAESILLKVRFTLLSVDTIQQLLGGLSYFSKDDGCVELLNEIINLKNKSFQKGFSFIQASQNRFIKMKSSTYLTSRYCNQKDFSMLICGGYDSNLERTVNDINYLDVSSDENIIVIPPMITKRYDLKVVCLQNVIYIFGGRNDINKRIMSVDKYTSASKTWSQVAKMYDDRRAFCVCGFMDKIFILGGRSVLRTPTSCCLQFDTSDCSWEEVSRMNKARAYAACVVFQDRIVVSGGWDDNYCTLKTVESYDVLPNKWSPMPNMNTAKFSHSLVVVENKLFVISKGADTCEVFDNICKNFVTMKSPELYRSLIISASSIADHIYVLQDNFPKLFVLDTVKMEWSEESCEVTKYLQDFSCVKVSYF